MTKDELTEAWANKITKGFKNDLNYRIVTAKRGHVMLIDSLRYLVKRCIEIGRDIESGRTKALNAYSDEQTETNI